MYPGSRKKQIRLTPFYFRHRLFVLTTKNTFQNQVAGSNVYFQKRGAETKQWIAFSGLQLGRKFKNANWYLSRVYWMNWLNEFWIWLNHPTHSETHVNEKTCGASKWQQQITLMVMVMVMTVAKQSHGDSDDDGSTAGWSRTFKTTTVDWAFNESGKRS